MPCIYFGDKPDLTYNSQEHVFPLGLGGIQKLPKGTVSDQANNKFSPLELKFMQESLVAFHRAMEGPGTTPKHRHCDASESQIIVAKMNDKPTLCYLKKGKPHPIYQFSVFDGHAGVSLPINGSIDAFTDNLRKFENTFTYLQSDFLNNNDFIIGYHNNKFYVATKDKSDRMSIGNRLQFEIDRFLKAKNKDDFVQECGQVQLDMRITESIQTERVYAKIALNVITHLLGTEYTFNRFNKVKNWIITGDGENIFTHRTTPNDFSSIMQFVPNSSHWCFFLPINGHLIGEICFYNDSACQRSFDFEVSDYPDHDSEILDYPDHYLNGFICDWKNQREYTLLELISLPEEEIAKNIANFQQRLILGKRD